MKRINYRAVMVVLCPIISTLYTLSAIMRYADGAGKLKVGLSLFPAVIWWVCGIMWVWLYYRDKKLKADIQVLEQKIAESQAIAERELAYWKQYRVYFCEYISRIVKERCNELKLTPEVIAECLGYRLEEVEAVFFGELNAQPDHMQNIFSFLAIDVPDMEDKANQYAVEQMGEHQ